jgi:tetratricopeptide (TPR) repeat protein
MQRQVRNALDAGEGDYRLRALRERMALEPDNLALRLELARHYREHGAGELALEHCRLAAARFPESGEVRLEMVRSLRSMGLRAEAAEILEEFLKQHPQASPDFSSWLGILRSELGQTKAAEEAHRAALALAPNRDALHNNLGYSLLEQQRYEEAAEEFRRALELSPRSEVARNNLELALTARHGSGGSAAAHNNLGALLIEQGRYEEARKELEQALAADRNFAAALGNLRLVSELDRRPATVPARAPAPHWTAFFGTVWHGLWGIEKPRQAGEPAGRAGSERASVPSGNGR